MGKGAEMTGWTQKESREVKKSEEKERLKELK